jgi:RNA polymerase sigma-70 factor (ECF subfamily)
MAKTPEQLLREARTGRQESIMRLFDDHHLPLFRFAWRFTGSIADADDIVQECFLALLRPGCNFDPARAPIRTYLFGAVRNQWLKRLRLREPGVPPESVNPCTPETEAVRSELAAAVAKAIAGLPESQREVLVLAHYEQLSLGEIAEITHLEIAAVKSRLQRARASMKDSLAAFAPRTERSI